MENLGPTRHVLVTVGHAVEEAEKVSVHTADGNLYTTDFVAKLNGFLSLVCHTSPRTTEQVSSRVQVQVLNPFSKFELYIWTQLDSCNTIGVRKSWIGKTDVPGPISLNQIRFSESPAIAEHRCAFQSADCCGLGIQHDAGQDEVIDTRQEEQWSYCIQARSFQWWNHWNFVWCTKTTGSSLRISFKSQMVIPRAHFYRQMEIQAVWSGQETGTPLYHSVFIVDLKGWPAILLRSTAFARTLLIFSTRTCSFAPGMSVAHIRTVTFPLTLEKSVRIWLLSWGELSVADGDGHFGLSLNGSRIEDWMSYFYLWYLSLAITHTR